MSKEFNSEYYYPMEETAEKFGIEPEAIPYTAADIQGLEEVFFGFTMFLIT